MRVGLYFDMRNPPAWAVDPSRLYGFSLEMCEEAEHLAFELLEPHKIEGVLQDPADATVILGCAQDNPAGLLDIPA